MVTILITFTFTEPIILFLRNDINSNNSAMRQLQIALTPSMQQVSSLFRNLKFRKAQYVLVIYLSNQYKTSTKFTLP